MVDAPAQAIVQHIDGDTTCIFAEVPHEKVVLFQAFFELEEGLAVVRTVDPVASVLALVTTRDLVEDCLAMLDSLREELHWRTPAVPPSGWKPFAEKPGEHV